MTLESLTLATAERGASIGHNTYLVAKWQVEQLLENQLQQFICTLP